VFSAALTPPTHVLTGELLASLTAISIIPFIESTRAKRPLVLAAPTLIGLAYQKFSGGIVLPLYWLIFVWTHPRSVPHSGTKIRSDDAESTALAMMLGYMIPTFAMYWTAEPRVVAAWQVFPVWISIVFYLTKFVRRSSKRTVASGYHVTQSTLFLGFLTSAVVHWKIVILSTLQSEDPLRTALDVFIPYLYAPPPSQTTSVSAAGQLLRWDAIFIVLSGLAAGFYSLWVLDFRGLFRGFLGVIVGTLLFGPGSAVAGLWMWREKCLKDGRVSNQYAKKR
jgi:hypothetical protein